MLRDQHGITMVQLADLLGYSTHSYISEIEAGKKMPTVEFVLAVSKMFDVSIDSLMKDELELPRAKRARLPRKQR